MTTVKLIKNIPSSSYHTGSGEVTLNIKAFEMTFNSKKAMIKQPAKRSDETQTSEPTDQPDNIVVDLQSIEETLVVRAYLDDDDSETAWNKMWKLRAMSSSGGPLKSLTLGDSSAKIIFGEGGIWDPYLEEVTLIVKADDSGDITVSNKSNEARIEVSFSIYFGNKP
jgi:hypothetical protein